MKNNHQVNRDHSDINPQQSISVQVMLYLRDLVVLFSVVMVLFLLLFRVVVVSGSSMNNTLEIIDELHDNYCRFL